MKFMRDILTAGNWSHKPSAVVQLGLPQPSFYRGDHWPISDLVDLRDIEHFEVLNIAQVDGKGWFEVRNDSSKEAAEILIYDQIGKDWFSNDGVNAKDFRDELKAIAKDRDIHVHINSPGGNVWDGFAIYNMLAERRAHVTVFVDGIAASIASVIAMAGKEIRMPRNASMMIHDPMGMCGGDAEDMRKMADVLDKHADQIAGVYANRSGKPKETYRDAMRAETWMNADEAKALGLCDTITEEVTISASANFDLSRFQRVPGAIAEKLKNSAAKRGGANNENTHMNREAIIALLKAQGIDVPKDITDEALIAKLENALKAKKEETKVTVTAVGSTGAGGAGGIGSPQNDATAATIKSLQDAVSLLTEQNKAEKKARITAAVNKCAEEGRIPANTAEKWIARALADETIIAELQSLPEVDPGAAPLNAEVNVTSEDPKEIGKGVLKLWNKGLTLWGGDGVQSAKASMDMARQRASIVNREMGRLLPFLNAAVSTNTVSSDLKRVVILQQMIRAFAIRILPLNAFSTVFNGVKLQGTDEVVVPYFPLITTASEDFAAATGYNTAHNTNSSGKKVTVDKRKYQLITWTSAELSRQPFQDVGMAALLAGEQLGLDVVNNVLSAVLIAAFAGLAKSSPAGSFDSDDVADIKGVCDTANWPAGGRSLILNSAYDINLLKDQAVKNAMAFGDTDPIREGRIKRILGFDYYPDSRVPNNAENLQGFAAFKSAMLTAFAPVDPTAEVRSQLAQYELVIEPTTNAIFEYRRWGDADLDVSKQVVESNFGKVAGEPTAIQRVTS